MKKFKLKNKKNRMPWFVSVSTFLLLMVILFFGVNKFERIFREQNLLLTKQAIDKAVIQCYANEGFYPASLSYLEENYYLTIDYDSYHVYYECIASNLVPEVEVFKR